MTVTIVYKDETGTAAKSSHLDGWSLACNSGGLHFRTHGEGAADASGDCVISSGTSSPGLCYALYELF